MTDNNQDRSQDQGQQGIDRDTEQRNRENETGQAGSEQFGQKDDQTPQSDTTLSERTGQTGGQESAGLGSSDEGGSGFVGSQGDQSSDYLTKGEENQDFAAEGQGAQDTSAGKSDIETGQSQDNQPDTDDGSDANR